MIEGQIYYIATKKDVLAIAFDFGKLRSYLVSTKVVAYINHVAIKPLIAKKVAKSIFIKWILLLQEFDLEISDKKGMEENQVAYHLSRL